MSTPMQDEFDANHAKRMVPAIRAGSVQAVREVFTSLGTPSQFRLQHYLLDVLWMDDYEYVSRDARSENKLNKGIMAKTEAAFENGLADIVRVMAEHTKMVPSDNEAPAQHAFTLSYPYRLPATLAVVQETLMQDPSWQPNIRKIFENIGVAHDEDRQAIVEYRADTAANINVLGAAVTNWLMNEAPPSLAMRMSGPNRAYWQQEVWRTDAGEMPWQSEAQQREEFAQMKAIAALIPKTESNLLVASPQGMQAKALGQDLISQIATKAKNNPSNS